MYTLATARILPRRANSHQLSVVDRVGDELSNKGEHNRKHNKVLHRAFTAEAAVATGPVILGDKGSNGRPGNDAQMREQFNNDHRIDFASVGSADNGADTCHEVKCKAYTKQPGFSASAKGGVVEGRQGHHFAFATGEPATRVEVLGREARGRPSDPPFDPATGKGRVTRHRGDFHDALCVKKNRVVLWYVENSGAIAGGTMAHMRKLDRASKRGAGSRDNTKYGRSRLSAKSFLQHHTQRISLAAVTEEADHILHNVNVLKSLACGVA